MAVELASELLEILVCPNCHSRLAVDHDRDELVCTNPECGLAYPVRDGIPVMLIDEARRPGGGDEARRLGGGDEARRLVGGPGGPRDVPADSPEAEAAFRHETPGGTPGNTGDDSGQSNPA